jgi:hypothetical protein
LKRHKNRRGTSSIANSYMMQSCKMVAIYVGRVQGLQLQGNFIREPLSCNFKLSISSKNLRFTPQIRQCSLPHPLQNIIRQHQLMRRLCYSQLRYIYNKYYNVSQPRRS